MLNAESHMQVDQLAHPGHKMEEVGWGVIRTPELGTFFVAFMLLTSSISHSFDTATYYKTVTGNSTFGSVVGTQGHTRRE